MAKLLTTNLTNAPKKFFTNEGVLSVLGASLAGGLAQSFIQNLVVKNPLLARNLAIGMIIGGIALFVLAIKFVPSGGLRFMAIGVAASVGLAGVTPFLQRVLPIRGLN